MVTGLSCCQATLSMENVLCLGKDRDLGGFRFRHQYVPLKHTKQPLLASGYAYAFTLTHFAYCKHRNY